MTQQDLLLALTVAFSRYRVPYMITGSLAVSFYGRPRYTHDVDIVLDVLDTPRKNLSEPLKLLEKKFLLFVDPNNVTEADLASGMLTLLDRTSGMKVDLWVLERDDFSASAFQRRVKKRVFGRVMCFISPEDLIVKKLSWFQQSGSSRHLEDAYTVYRGQKARLDESYLHAWVEKLNLTSQWQQLLTMPNPQH